MSYRDAFVATLQAALPHLKERYPIQSLGVFGSFARGDASQSSDLDILVEFARPVPLSKFLALEAELAALTGQKVDLVSRQALKPYMARNVMRDLVPV
jgi:uncharacterized protein